MPVDEALRTWTAHLVTAAASVLALLPLGALLLVAGIDLGDRVTEGFDLLPVALVAGGFSALAAGLAVAGLPADLAAPGARRRPRAGRLTAAAPVAPARPAFTPVALLTATGRGPGVSQPADSARLSLACRRGHAATWLTSASLARTVADRTVFVIVS